MDAKAMLERALEKTRKAAAAGTEVATIDVAVTQTPAQVDRPPELTELLQTISELSDELTKEHPQIAMYAQIIHGKLIQFPELVHMLDDDEISVVYRAALIQSDTKLVKEKKSAERKTKAIQIAAGQDW